MRVGPFAKQTLRLRGLASGGTGPSRASCAAERFLWCDGSFLDDRGPKGCVPVLVAFEGIDGVGKTTQVSRLTRVLESEGHPTRVVASNAECIRLAVDAAGSLQDPMSEFLGFAAAIRASFLHQVLPQLHSGDVVLADRYALSLIAYQGYGAGLDLQMCKRVATAVVDRVIPDVLVLLDASTRHALARQEGSDAIERRGIDFFERVRQGYLNECGEWGRIVVVSKPDATADTIEWQVRETVLQLVRDMRTECHGRNVPSA